MQRTPQNMMPPRGRQQQNQNTGRPQGGGQSIPASPALTMARRIRNEQGQERAKQYLMAMEPFLAPAERAHIAEQLGVPLPARPVQQRPGQVRRRRLASSRSSRPHFPECLSARQAECHLWGKAE